MTLPPPDGSDELIVLLSACKFLDLVLVLQTEEFQVHQWMFLTDTVDAVYRPDDWVPESIMDQLAEIIGELPDARGHKSDADGVEVQMAHHASVLNQSLASSALFLRQPLLTSVRSVESIKDLVPFFSHVSLISYESVYCSAAVAGSNGAGTGSAGGAVDWAAVDNLLMDEIFEGR